MLSRRNALKNMAASALVLASAPAQAARTLASLPENELPGRLRQSVCRWCFSHLSMQELCDAGKAIGLEAIDLVAPADFDTVRKAGLKVSMVSPDGLKDYLRIGWNHKEHHAHLVEFYTKLIDQAADYGYSNVIVFSGNRNGIDDETGLINCAQGLQRILPQAEKRGVNLIMELLNSKVDHHDYQADHTAWGVELAKTIGSERFSLLYDIYHMQIMEGDVIRSIRDYGAYISHYHTAGVPGRNEIGDDQELNYPAIMRAIADSGFKGFVAQEFIPKNEDKIASLRDAVRRCTV
jgi:hydroxypyruvate isomerase